MKAKPTLFIIIVATIMLVIFVAIRSITGEEGGHAFKSGKRQTAGDVPDSKITEKNDVESNSLNSAVETIDRKSPAIEKADYKILGRENIPLALDKKTMMERIEKGMGTMEMVEFRVYPDAEVLIMEKAYERLIGSLSFIDSKFPIWGVDTNSHFVFSGRTGTDPESTFEYGFAVKKENGRIYRWFAPQYRQK